MDIFVFLSNFLYRIRYKLFFGTVIAVFLAIFISSFLPKRYNATTTIFTGITSKVSVDDMSGRTDWLAANNAHENIINIIKSKSTLEIISIKLLAQHLIYGDPEKDNNYLYASNYNKILSITPKEVLDLVDKSSFEQTVTNFMNFKKDTRGNFLYDIFNWDNDYYGYISLSKIQVSRKGSSDMIEISYQEKDPGIATNTLIFLNEELSKRYETLLLAASNDVVKHFEEQLALAKLKLEASEDELVRFNVENKIINYEEQTKHLAALNNIIENRYNEVMLEKNSSEALKRELEIQMDTRSKLIFENELFISKLSDISALNGKIAEIEIFDSNTSDNELLKKYKEDLVKAEKSIKGITDKMEQYKVSKEGVAISEMVSQWLTALLNAEKSKAELRVMDEKRQEMEKQYEFYSPVGPNLGKQTRNVRVEEESYLTILHHLGLAKLKQKNILLDAGTIQVVTPPAIPLLVIPRKRELFVIASFFGAIVFIIGFYLIIEMIDRTLRDGMRTERLTKRKVIAAFSGSKQVKYRRHNKEVEQITTTHLASWLNGYIEPKKTFVINLLSIENKEGKKFIAGCLERFWKEKGFKVSSLSYEDILAPNSKDFLHASSLYDIPIIREQHADPDIILAQYAPLRQSAIPKALLETGAINILIINAERVWSVYDKTVFEDLRNRVGDEKLFIVLNKADREAVEQYTGQLPPYTPLRKLIYRWMNLGITAKS